MFRQTEQPTVRLKSMSRIILLLATLATACTDVAPTIDVVAFRDPACGPDAAEDCIVVVPPHARVTLPTSEFELIVHSDVELGPIAIESPAPAHAEPIGRVIDPSGVSETLLVSPLGFGSVEVSSCGASLELFSADPNRYLRYPSGYSSNCYCLSCTAYCSVNGKTEKAGICC